VRTPPKPNLAIRLLGKPSQLGFQSLTGSEIQISEYIQIIFIQSFLGWGTRDFKVIWLSDEVRPDIPILVHDSLSKTDSVDI